MCDRCLGEWVPMPEAQEVRRSETGGILLRLKSGREEWFPLAHVVHTERGWFMKRWLYEERTGAGKRVDTTNMGPRKPRGRAAFIDSAFLFWLAVVLPVAVAVVWIASCDIHTNTTLRLERRAMPKEIMP